MKKVLALFLALAIMLSVCACGSSPAPVSEPSAAVPVATSEPAAEVPAPTSKPAADAPVSTPDGAADETDRLAKAIMGSYKLEDIASPAEAEAARSLIEVTSKEEAEVTMYSLYSIISEQKKVIFFNGNKAVPYLEMDELFNNLRDLYVSDIGFGLTTTYGDHYYMAIRENGDYALIDFENGMVAYSDYDMFGRSTSAVSGGDVLAINTQQLNADGSVKTDESGVPLVNLMRRQDTQRNFIRQGYSLAVPLALGKIPIYWEDGKGYMPITTFADLFLSQKSVCWLYNGKNLFLTLKTGFDATVPNDEGKTLKDIAFDVPDKRTPELAEYTYRELVMMLDGNYGLRDEHAIGNDFDQYLAAIGLRDRLLSPSGAEFSDALGELLLGYFGDLHSGLNQGSPFTGADYSFNKEAVSNLSPSVATFLNNMERFASARSNTNCVDGDGTVVPYREVGNTAFLTFDSFVMSFLLNYYDPAVKESLHDIIGSDNVALVHYANEQVNRKNSPIKNVVIDLSNNGGGMADAAFFVSSWVLGTCNFSTVNPLSKAQYTVGYQADVDLDGYITDADHLDLSKVNAYCLITANSFSCGNMVPALFKQSGMVTLLGQQSGGGACVVEQTMAADGTVYQFSGRYRLSTVKNGSYYSIDQGVAPDFTISDPDHLYDRKWLANYINQLP